MRNLEIESTSRMKLSKPIWLGLAVAVSSKLSVVARKNLRSGRRILQEEPECTTHSGCSSIDLNVAHFCSFEFFCEPCSGGWWEESSGNCYAGISFDGACTPCGGGPPPAPTSGPPPAPTPPPPPPPTLPPSPSPPGVTTIPLVNPSFENGTAGWTSSSGGGLVHRSDDLAAAPQGRGYLALDSSTSARQTLPVTVEAGKTYSVKVWARSTNPATTSTTTPSTIAKLSLNVLDSNGNPTGTAESTSASVEPPGLTEAGGGNTVGDDGTNIW